jgi:hypothetical protein
MGGRNNDDRQTYRITSHARWQRRSNSERDQTDRAGNRDHRMEGAIMKIVTIGISDENLTELIHHIAGDGPGRCLVAVHELFAIEGEDVTLTEIEAESARLIDLDERQVQ